MDVKSTALAAIRAGLAPIPIRADDKVPLEKWTADQHHPMDPSDIYRRFRNGCNIGIACGSGSGGLECLDFDAPELWQPFLDTLEGANHELHGRLTVWQETCSGGYHLLYRISGTVGSNTTLAKTAAGEVAIETRGQGGQFVVAPSTAKSKHDGKAHPYILHGDLAAIPTITPEDVQLLHGLARSFDESGAQQQHQAGSRPGDNAGDRPGDRYNRETDWQELLVRYGWRYLKTIGERQHWQRPGKTGPEASATLHPTKGLYCWSTSTPLPTEKPLTPFAVLTYYEHGGDFAAAARAIMLEYSKNSDFWTNQDTLDSSVHSGQQRQRSGQSSGQLQTIAADLLSFIEMDPAPFTNNDVISALCLKDRQQKKALYQALYYYEKQGKISKIEGKRGHWEVVENEVQTMDLLTEPPPPLNISLPLGISKHVIIRPGSVVLVAGASNAGKTVFLLQTVQNFLWPHIYPAGPTPPFSTKKKGGVPPPMVYLNSEMSADELRTRIEGVGGVVAEWVQHVRFIQRSHSFDKLVEPDGITFVDFLEVVEDFFLAGKYLSAIHRKLRNGLAIVSMQKKQGAEHAKGGEMTLEKPRLAINLDRNEPHGFTCKVVKAKEPRDYLNPIQGKEIDFVLNGASQLVPISGWRFVNDRQRKAINQDYSRSGLPRHAMRGEVEL